MPCKNKTGKHHEKSYRAFTIGQNTGYHGKDYRVQRYQDLFSGSQMFHYKFRAINHLLHNKSHYQHIKTSPDFLVFCRPERVSLKNRDALFLNQANQNTHELNFICRYISHHQTHSLMHDLLYFTFIKKYLGKLNLKGGIIIDKAIDLLISRHFLFAGILLICFMEICDLLQHDRKKGCCN